MNTEELAFVNRQLAGMLKSGIPLEAGLKKMTESMSSGRLKDQLGQLGDRLEKGQPVEQAVEGLDLPDTYKRLLVLKAVLKDADAQLLSPPSAAVDAVWHAHILDLSLIHI